MYCIYKAQNKINNKCYVGFTSNALKKRKYQHKQKAYQNSPFAFHDAIRKYGWNNFEWEILYESWDGEHCLTIMEPFFISEYNSFGEHGYNMDKGGRKGMMGLKRKPLTEEQKKNISIGTKKHTLKGKEHPMYGSKANERFLESAKTSMLGKKHSIQTKQKQSESRKIYLKNNASGMQGKKHSSQTKNIMREKSRSVWKLNYEDNSFVIIKDLVDYCNINNLNYKTVYSWKYKYLLNKKIRLQKV